MTASIGTHRLCQTKNAVKGYIISARIVSTQTFLQTGMGTDAEKSSLSLWATPNFCAVNFKSPNTMLSWTTSPATAPEPYVMLHCLLRLLYEELDFGPKKV